MVDCKYILPCGRCDKLGAPCEAIEYKALNTTDECEHEWRYSETNNDLFHYACTKCGITRIIPLGNLFSVNKRCNHDWHIVGSVAGTKAQYKVFVCSKCKAQQTEKKIILPDGKFDICFIDEMNT